MNIRDVLTLSDSNEYVIASKVNYNNKIWLCLVDINNHKNIKYCYLDNDEIVVVKKETINDTLLLKMMSSMLKELKD